MPLNAGVAFVDVLPDATKFGAVLQAQMRSATSGAGRSLSQVGTFLSRTLTLGVVAAGAAATKASLEYEQAFTRIAAISNTSAQQVEAWKQEVLDLAGATAQAPQELARALFFLSSAGLETAQVMEALEASAKASAIGLGETEDIAKITANVLNAYADSGLTAARATDILVAGVRESTAETDEFSTALGRILPIASKAGVGFDAVVGSLSALSNIGLDVNEGVTAMRTLLNALVAPGKQAAEAMDSLGLSAQELLDAIEEDGLIGALQLLDEAARRQTNTQAEYIGVLRRIIPNIRGLTGQLGLTGENADNVAGIFDRVANSTGSLDRALATTAEGPMFKLEQSFARLQAEMIRAGRALIPLVTTFAEFGAKLGPVFRVLPQLLQVFLGYQALRIIPPILRAIALGMVAINAGAAANRVNAYSNALANLGIVAKTTLAAGLLGIPIALRGIQDELQSGESRFKEIGQAVGLTRREFDLLNDAIGGASISGLQDPFVRNKTVVQEAAAAYAQLKSEVLEAGLSEDDLTRALAANSDQLDRNRANNLRVIEDIRAALGLTDAWTVSWQALGAQQNAVADATTNRTVRAIQRLEPPSRRAIGLLDEMGTSFGELQRAAIVATQEGGQALTTFRRDALEKAKQAIQDFRDAAFENLTNIGGIIADLANSSSLSIGKITAAFDKQRERAQSFARDLLLIADTGGRAGEALARQLLTAGEAGRIVAAEIAGAGKQAREDAVRSFGRLAKVGEDLATRLTRSMVGVLKDIRGLLAELTGRPWKTRVEGDNRDAKRKVRDVRQDLASVTGTKWTVPVGADISAAEAKLDALAQHLRLLTTQTFQVDISADVPGRALEGATGLHATVREPTWILAGEGRRGERVDITPLPGPKSDSGDMRGLVITGTLQTPFGPAEVRGMVQRELGSDRGARTIERSTERRRMLRGV